jgi:hypothetical protein
MTLSPRAPAVTRIARKKRITNQFPFSYDTNSISYFTNDHENNNNQNLD